MALTEQDFKNLPETGIDPDNSGKYQALLDDLQGNILKGHGRDYTVDIFVQWKSDDIPAVKEWIINFTKGYVTSAQLQADESRRYRDQKVSGSVFANFYLTRIGYETLGFEAFQIPKNQPFTMGMQYEGIRTSLGDPKVTDWEVGYQQKIHSLIAIADDDQDSLLKFANQITQELSKIATVLHQENGFILRNKDGQVIEHFGFVDGISQPLFIKRDIVKAQASDRNFSKWDPRAPLDLVLVKDPNGQTEDSYGSYLVYRKLEQNVKAFREDQQALAQALKIQNELAGAYVMGRFPDGTPVTISDVPMHPRNPPNNFNYDQDLTATKCPFHAHIRKTNPRGDSVRNSNVNLEEERGHRIARRAVSYGEKDLTNASTEGSGLLFLCFQADIENQFNFMQARWSNANNFVKVGVGPDPLIGSPQGTQHWPTEWSKSSTQDYNFKLWVKMKGGEYFFAPSISSLKNLP
ncbi:MULTISPECIES: Dyp-type peroxidase [Pseudanabaena]|nr:MULTISPECIES: Dyp-type peroxidase [Pseudanabaena]MDG3494105.1 Dyp-type peroxidase [Pseudanabaena catenata USMAC16]